MAGRSRLSSLIAGFLTMIAVVFPTTGAELRVPSDHETIQAAIEASSDGDVILVAPGTYFEALNLLGKEITLRSTGGAAVTVLDGDLHQSSIVMAVSGETSATTIEGFTFLNGTGHFTAACRLGGNLGGAILLLNSGLTVLDSVFVDNGGADEAGEFTTNGGGAIFACSSDLTIRRSRFDGNAATVGGAILFRGANRTASISHSRFTGNEAANGGGIEATIEAESRIEIDRSDFSGNEAAHGGGLRLVTQGRSTAEITHSRFFDGAASFGGGANVFASGESNVEMDEVDFIRNEAGFGGGLFLIADGDLPVLEGPTVRIDSGRFLANVAHPCCNVGVYVSGCFSDGTPGSNEYYGGGADVRTDNGGLVTITNSLFARNSGNKAGGVHAYSCEGGTISFVNCTMTDNDQDGLHLRLGRWEPEITAHVGEILVTNSIIAGNRGGERMPVEFEAEGPTVTITFSDVEGGFEGIGNLDATPAFVDSGRCNYRLAAGSAGIDAGDNGAIGDDVTTDLGNRDRRVDDPDVVDMGSGTPPVIDMGAYERQMSGGPATGRRRTVISPIQIPCPDPVGSLEAPEPR